MKRVTKYFLNSLIVFYLGVIYFSGMPESNTLNTRLKDKAMSAAFILGIWPSWSMFAPNPIRFDSKTYVAITHKNGERKEYDVEKKLEGPFATFRKARWMKYSQDNLRNPGQSALLDPAIRYFTRKYDHDENPVVNVQIFRRWNEIAPFSNKRIHSIYQTPRYPREEILVTRSLER